jgi:hypothetical protein
MKRSSVFLMRILKGLNVLRKTLVQEGKKAMAS